MSFVLTGFVGAIVFKLKKAFDWNDGKKFRWKSPRKFTIVIISEPELMKILFFAFDCEIIIRKLEHNKFSVNIMSLSEIFLTNRTQYVLLNGQNSDRKQL